MNVREQADLTSSKLAHVCLTIIRLTLTMDVLIESHGEKFSIRYN